MHLHRCECWLKHSYARTELSGYLIAHAPVKGLFRKLGMDLHLGLSDACAPMSVSWPSLRNWKAVRLIVDNFTLVLSG